VVNGDDVEMYGLAAEHTLQDIVQWNGDRGAVYFFQAELPYDVKSYPYAGLAVASGVQAFRAYGCGVYHFFRDFNVTVQSAMTCPASLEGSFVDPLAVFLNGKVSSAAPPSSFFVAQQPVSNSRVYYRICACACACACACQVDVEGGHAAAGHRPAHPERSGRVHQ
jgi:hypothetical protein